MFISFFFDWMGRFLPAAGLTLETISYLQFAVKKKALSA